MICDKSSKKWQVQLRPKGKKIVCGGYFTEKAGRSARRTCPTPGWLIAEETVVAQCRIHGQMAESGRSKGRSG